MNMREFLSAAATAAITATIAMPACADRQRVDLVGSWFGTVTALNPSLGSFNDVISFHADGVVTESRRYALPGTPLGNLLETSGHGAWERKGGGALEAFFRFLVQDVNSGIVLGTDNVRLWLTLDARAGTLSGTFRSEIKDIFGNLVFGVTGTYSATPIAV